MECSRYKKEFMVTWNKEWVGKYESPWSIFEKIKLANHATTEDIFYLFGNQESKRIITNNWGKYLRNLLTLEGMEERKFEILLGLSVKNNNQQNIEHLTNIFLFPRNKKINFFRENISYCLDCIKVGHHSIFHQFKLLDYCPFHMKELTHVCKTCKSSIPYTLSKNLSVTPFECSCGKALFNYTSNYSSIWNKVTQLTIQDPLLKKWLNINATSSSKVFYQLDLFDNSSNDVLELIINVLQVEMNRRVNFPLSYISVDSKPNILGVIPEVEKNTYNLCKSIYKSLVRNLKKTILFKHKTCIVRYKKMAPDIEVCPYAYAYINWRKDIEGLNNNWNVENGTKKINKGYQFFSKADNPILINIYNFFSSNPDLRINHLQLIKVLTNIMVTLSLNHFYTWLSFAAKYSSAHINIHNAPLTYDNFPFIIIGKENPKYIDELQLVFRPLKINKPSLPILTCPFKSIKLRRK